ncbi:MAG: class I SAM-dependent methyltransferase [Bacteroidota bacterium]
MQAYDSITATHYAAWRPPLHDQLLARALAPNERFRRGLDVGCGTGQSTLALAKYCDSVVGIDPSLEMITLAKGSPEVCFLAHREINRGLRKGLAKEVFDIFTFAGSLHYQDTNEVLAQIKPIAAPKASIVVYDFDVGLNAVFKELGKLPATGDYNHAKNLGGAVASGLQTIHQEEDQLLFSAAPEEVGHLLFSVRDWREGVLASYDYEVAVHKLRERFGQRIELAAEIFVTRYLLHKS